VAERSYKVDEFKNRAPRSDPFYEAVCRAMVAVLRGNYAEAIRHIELAIDGFVALGDIQGEGRARSKAVIVFRRGGNAQRAIQEAQRALACLQQRPDPGYAAMVHLEIGQLEAERGNIDAGLGHYQAGLALVGEPIAGEAEVVASSRAFLADVMANCLAVRGEWDRVERLRRSAIASLEGLGQPHLDRDLVITYANLGRDYVYTRRPKQAAAALGKAEAVLTAMQRRGEFDPECRASLDSARALLDRLLMRLGR
jgi:tetratricopeptide (TPR) repeat protein